MAITQFTRESNQEYWTIYYSEITRELKWKKIIPGVMFANRTSIAIGKPPYQLKTMDSRVHQWLDDHSFFQITK